MQNTLPWLAQRYDVIKIGLHLKGAVATPQAKKLFWKKSPPTLKQKLPPNKNPPMKIYITPPIKIIFAPMSSAVSDVYVGLLLLCS